MLTQTSIEIDQWPPPSAPAPDTSVMSHTTDQRLCSRPTDATDTTTDPPNNPQKAQTSEYTTRSIGPGPRLIDASFISIEIGQWGHGASHERARARRLLSPLRSLLGKDSKRARKAAKTYQPLSLTHFLTTPITSKHRAGSCFWTRGRHRRAAPGCTNTTTSSMPNTNEMEEGAAGMDVEQEQPG